MVAVLALCFTLLTFLYCPALCDTPKPQVVVEVFSDDPIHFDTHDSRGDARESIHVLDNGRIIQTTVDLPESSSPVRILAHVSINPVPKDEQSMHDNWDRAGSVLLMTEGQPNLELVKFVTAYGGQTDWTVDVSHLAPVLRGTRQLAAFIDTWVSPAWRVDVSLEFTEDSTSAVYHWVTPVFFEDSFDFGTYADSGVVVGAAIPGNQQRVKLFYMVSGHCTDGRGADEFVKRDNVLLADGTVVYRYQPWRDDCRQFREINPYTRRWSTGVWSSDYSRSGWCPGDVVDPLVLDLTDHFAEGNHDIGIRIESIRPEGEDGHKGFWRVSAYLVGLTDPQ